MSEQHDIAPERLLTSAELAERLKVNERTVYRLRGLPRIRVGRQVRFRASDVEEWLRANEESA